MFSLLIYVVQSGCWLWSFTSETWNISANKNWKRNSKCEQNLFDEYGRYSPEEWDCHKHWSTTFSAYPLKILYTFYSPNGWLRRCYVMNRQMKSTLNKKIIEDGCTSYPFQDWRLLSFLFLLNIGLMYTAMELYCGNLLLRRYLGIISIQCRYIIAMYFFNLSYNHA